MGPTWGRQDPGGPHVGPMNPAIWVINASVSYNAQSAFLYNIFRVRLASLLIARSPVLTADALYIEIAFSQIEYDIAQQFGGLSAVCKTINNNNIIIIKFYLQVWINCWSFVKTLFNVHMDIYMCIYIYIYIHIYMYIAVNTLYTTFPSTRQLEMGVVFQPINWHRCCFYDKSTRYMINSFPLYPV